MAAWEANLKPHELGSGSGAHDDHGYGQGATGRRGWVARGRREGTKVAQGGDSARGRPRHHLGLNSPRVAAGMLQPWQRRQSAGRVTGGPGEALVRSWREMDPQLVLGKNGEPREAICG